MVINEGDFSIKKHTFTLTQKSMQMALKILGMTILYHFKSFSLQGHKRHFFSTALQTTTAFREYVREKVLAKSWYFATGQNFLCQPFILDVILIYKFLFNNVKAFCTKIDSEKFDNTVYEWYKLRENKINHLKVT